MIALLQPEVLAEMRDKNMIGRNNPRHDWVTAAKRIAERLPPILEQANLEYRWRCGGGIILKFNIKDADKWNDLVNRIANAESGAGLLVEVYKATNPDQFIIMQFWPRPLKSWKENPNETYPRINMPTGMSVEQVHALWTQFNIYQLTVRYREHNHAQMFSFCAYHNIPRQYWQGRPKFKGSIKDQLIEFRGFDLGWQIAGEHGHNIATQLRQAINMAPTNIPKEFTI